MSVRRFFPVILTLALTAAPVLAQPKDPPKESYLRSHPQLIATVSKIAEKPSQYTLRVFTNDKEAALATVVGADGWLLTKHSELKGEPIVQLKDGRKVPAKVVGVHPLYDLAMLKIDAKGLPVAEWRNSKEDAVGSWAISPGPDKEAVGLGVVSVQARTGLSGPRFTPNPNGGYLGVMMGPSDKGVKIESVQKDTPADKAGLKADDIITALDGQEVRDNDDMLQILGKKKPGEIVVVQLLRDNSPKEIKVTLGKRPGGFNRGEMQNSMGSTLSERRTGFPAVLQHDTVLKPTDCGGPLVDLDGKVIGINIARAGRTESYAIPSEVVQTLLADLQSGKFPPPKTQTVTSSSNNSKEIKEIEEKLKKLNDERAASEKKAKELADQIKELEESLKKLKNGSPKK